MLFLRESEAYYFDEPTNALDPEMKKVTTINYSFKRSRKNHFN